LAEGVHQNDPLADDQGLGDVMAELGMSP